MKKWETATCAESSLSMQTLPPRRTKARDSRNWVARSAKPRSRRIDRSAAESERRVVFVDAASLGDSGPELAGLINAQAASLRIVVVGSPNEAWEAAYRKHKIFYYAVEPFSDNEIADILAAAFQTREMRVPKADLQKTPSEPISSISITNRNGHKVQLMAAPGLLWRSEGLGCQIGQRLLARLLPVAVTPGEAYLTPANILKTAGSCFRLMVLLARDSGHLPGSLAATRNRTSASIRGTRRTR